MTKRWNILPTDEVRTEALSASLKINPAICRILVQRGIDDYEKANEQYQIAKKALDDFERENYVNLRD